jgi:Protein of unknown function (DUF616)
MNKIVVYTAAFGSTVKLMPQKKFNGIDFICFADREYKVKGWQVKLINAPFPNDPRRSNRYYKIQPHLLLKEYDFSIYVDSNIIVLKSPLLLIEQEMKDVKMMGFDHNQTTSDTRNCIYKEYEALLQLKDKEGKTKDDPEIMKRQIEMFRAAGYPANNGLIKAPVLIRKHNDNEVINIMKEWWWFIENLSTRDQLSFNYVAWKNNFNIKYLQGDVRRNNQWFYMAAKSNESLFYTLLKFRIRQNLKALQKHNP